MPPPIYYFAYGANMSARVLARRRVRPLSAEVATLQGHELRFSHPGPPLIEPAFASVDPCPEARVYGVLYQISEAELRWLDRLEGRYQKKLLEVTGDRTGKVSARVYQTPTPVAGKRPSVRYLRLLLDGAKENKLPAEYISWLEAQPAFSMPVFSWVMARVVNQRDALFRWLRQK